MLTIRTQLCSYTFSGFGKFGNNILNLKLNSYFFGYRYWNRPNTSSCLLIGKYPRKKFLVRRTFKNSCGIISKKPFTKETDKLTLTNIVAMAGSSDYWYPNMPYQKQSHQYQQHGDRGHHQDHGNHGNRNYEGDWDQNSSQHGSSRGAPRGNSSYGRGQGNQRGNQGYSNNSGYQDRSRDQDPMFFLSKSLSYILRHGAEKQGLRFSKGGFILVKDILNLKKFWDYREEDVIEVVRSNDKQRFALEGDEGTGNLAIRANQGHTIEVEDLDLKPITLQNADEYPIVIHGTYMQSWDVIKKKGLSRMKRNHIHFAPGEPQSDGVISGMRKSCEVLIFLDLKAAIKDGLTFFVSANNVILSPGDKQGSIKPCYFEAAQTRSPRQQLSFDKWPSKVVSPGTSASKVVSPGTSSVKVVSPGTSAGKVVSPETLAEAADHKRKSKKNKKKKNKDKESTEGEGKKSRQDSSSDKHEAEGNQAQLPAECPENSVDDNVTFAESEPACKPDPVIKVIDNMEKVNDITEFWEKDCKEGSIYSVYCIPGNASEEGNEYGIICISDRDDNVYIFDTQQKEMVISSRLLDFLQNSKSLKVFCGCPGIAKVFVDAYELSMPHMTVFDIEEAYRFLKKTKESPSLEKICQELEVDTLSSAQSPDSMETSIDWSVRPITDQMKNILKNTALLQMRAAQKLRNVQPEATKKELNSLTYKSIEEYLGKEKMDKVREMQKERKKQQKTKEEKTKEEPVAKSPQKKKKGHHHGKNRK